MSGRRGGGQRTVNETWGDQGRNSRGEGGGGGRQLAGAAGAGGMEQSTETADESMVTVCRAGQSAKLALGAKYNSIGFLGRCLQFPYSLSSWVSEF